MHASLMVLCVRQLRSTFMSANLFRIYVALMMQCALAQHT